MSTTNNKLHLRNKIEDFFNINPFDDPQYELPYFQENFSRLTLEEQLNQKTDNASRRQHIITKQIKFFKEIEIVKKGDFVLDVGCGPGNYALELNKIFKNDIKYLGIDLGPAIIEYAKRLNLPSAYSFINSDIFGYKSSNLFTTILLTYDFYNSLSNIKSIKLLEILNDLLAPKGKLLLELKINSVGYEKYTCEYKYSEKGMFQNTPHLQITERGKLKKSIFGHRYIIIDLTEPLTVKEYRNFLRLESLESLKQKASLFNLELNGYWPSQKLWAYESSRGYVLLQKK